MHLCWVFRFNVTLFIDQATKITLNENVSEIIIIINYRKRLIQILLLKCGITFEMEHIEF